MRSLRIVGALGMVLLAAGCQVSGPGVGYAGGYGYAAPVYGYGSYGGYPGYYGGYRAPIYGGYGYSRPPVYGGYGGGYGYTRPPAYGGYGYSNQRPQAYGGYGQSPGLGGGQFNRPQPQPNRQPPLIGQNGQINPGGFRFRPGN